MGLWGGVDDTLKIGTNNVAPIFLVHGTSDATVPFTSGPPFGYASLADVFGSNSISKRLAKIGMPAADTYFVEGEGHEFHGASNGMWENGTGGNEYWDTIVQKSTSFFWQIHKPTAAFSMTANSLEVQFTDESSGAISWKWSFGDGGSSTEQNPLHTYGSSGTYRVNLYIQNENQSWDTLSQDFIIIDHIGLRELQTANIRVYPVPARGEVTIESNSPFHISAIKVYNSTGKEMPVSAAVNGKYAILDIRGWTSGVYFIRMSVEGIILSRKLIVN
ncbi:MAG: T9SS type A sorting domain-containing protein [Bacteroidales bacterium]|nr:T9SS type A sorting domain-containing protein [Bacteroidales bacterium]